MTRDDRVDVYIAKAAPFAQPILQQLRSQVHAACPTAVETIKWGFPHFTYQDHLLCSMAAFKQHCAFGFWHGHRVVEAASDEAMGQFGRITLLDQLPTAPRLAALIAKAMALIDKPMAPAPPRRRQRPPPIVPAVLRQALDQAPAAAAFFDRLSPSQQREYLDWLAEAKTVATHQRRLQTTLDWLAAGKQRHWKYQQ